MLTIEDLFGYEILDSRGRPTVAVRARLSDGTVAAAQVPSGASTGTHEALELRDGDPARYAGKGTRKAAAAVREKLLPLVRGMDAGDQQGVDRALIPLKQEAGANAVLGVSCAVARAVADSRHEPLWRVLAAGRRASIPVPMVNIFSGGLHAGRNIEFQDFLALPHGFTTFAEALHAVSRIHAAARKLCESSGLAMTGVADEGGWGPALGSNEQALDLLTRSIGRAGYKPGAEVSIAIDVAASHFFREGRYHLATENRVLDESEMTGLLESWSQRYPVISIEDGLHEDAWAGWVRLTERLGPRLQLTGDDLFTTNPARVRRGIESRAGNAVLVKMNQIGTLTETFEVIDLVTAAGWRGVVSARSGDTEDPFLADLAVASGLGQIKVGSVTRSERLAKYNRLLELESEGGLPFSTLGIVKK
ncbi:MAG: phosphopyruvate hydratase [Acidobacteria bacterium]|nr:phosphopyruvate hydratase [Acidobacteriota bacterium]